MDFWQGRKYALREKCFWSAFSHIRTETYSISPYSILMLENTDQNNSEYGHFSCSGSSENGKRDFKMKTVFAQDY